MVGTEDVVFFAGALGSVGTVFSLQKIAKSSRGNSGTGLFVISWRARSNVSVKRTSVRADKVLPRVAAFFETSA